VRLWRHSPLGRGRTSSRISLFFVCFSRSRRKPAARIVATSARRSAGVIVSGLWLRSPPACPAREAGGVGSGRLARRPCGGLGTIAFLRAVTYGREFGSVGVLLPVMIQTAEWEHPKKQANCWVSLHVDEVGRIHMFQRKREGEGRFRRGLAPERGHLVHMLPALAKAQDCATYARVSEKTLSPENAGKQREMVPPGNDGGGNGPGIETARHRTDSGVRHQGRLVRTCALRSALCRASRLQAPSAP